MAARYKNTISKFYFLMKNEDYMPTEMGHLLT